MGVRGLSILFSSGDDGSGGYDARNNVSMCKRAHIDFPASRSASFFYTLLQFEYDPFSSISPYVTSVGATQLWDESNLFCSDASFGLSCTTPREVGCSSATGFICPFLL